MRAFAITIQYMHGLDTSQSRSRIGNTEITDRVFADDAVILTESLEVLVMALVALHEEIKTLELQVSRPKTKFQLFGGLQSLHACDKNIEISENFTYLGSVVHNVGGLRQDVLRRIGLAHSVRDSFNTTIWYCRYLCRWTNIWTFSSLVIPVLRYGSVILTLNTDLKRRNDVFGTRFLSSIMGYRCYNFV